MRMYIANAAGRLTAQSRGVEVVDITDLHIEQVERVENDSRVARHRNDELAVHESGRSRSHTAVFD